MQSNGRKTREVSWLAKLSPAKVRTIRRLYEEGKSQAYLARRFFLSQASVSNLLSGRTYARVV
jgi:hypothetical protein